MPSHSGLRSCLVRHVRGRFILARAASCGLIRHGFVRRIPPPQSTCSAPPQSTCSAPLHFIMRAATRGAWIVPLRIGSDDSKIEMEGAAQRRRPSCEDGGNASQEHGPFRRSEASTVSLPGAPRASVIVGRRRPAGGGEGQHLAKGERGRSVPCHRMAQDRRKDRKDERRVEAGRRKPHGEAGAA